MKNILQNPDEYENRKRIGRSPKLFPTTLCKLFREASKGEKSLRNLQTSLDLNVTPRRVR